MPRIKRWHPISHDFNHDPQIIEARERFGDWIGYAWQECLSIADRNNGVVPGTLDQIAFRIASVSLGKYRGSAAKTARIFLEYSSNLGWILVENTQIRVLKYAEYHRTREPKPVPSGPDPTENHKNDSLKNHKNDSRPQPEMSVQDLVDSWNENFDGKLPKVQLPLSDSRKRKAAARLKEHIDLAFWQQVFDNIAYSPFLLGTGNGSWRCTLDFLIANDSNCLKIYEGVYSNAKQSR